MKVGFIHLSDIHVSDGLDLTEKNGKLLTLCNLHLQNVEIIFLIISGDIANSGSPKEYIIAKKDIQLIVQLLRKQLHNIPLETIIVPGNHDCNFEHDNQIRRNSISSPDYKSIGDDNSVLEACLSVQDDFWEFYRLFLPEPDNRIFYEHNFSIKDRTFRVICLNTAWMSSIQEKPGDLFFPVKNFDISESTADLSISVYHHPINWFTPNTTENNKNELEAFLGEHVQLQFFGHEHESQLHQKIDLERQNGTLAFSGYAYHQNSKKLNSGFQIATIDINDNKGSLFKYKWINTTFELENEATFILNQRNSKHFILNETFRKKINTISIPLGMKKDNTLLTEIFVFPDLDVLDSSSKEMGDYISSESLLNLDETRHSIIQGSAQSGKSSLLHSLFTSYYLKGYFPVLLNGSELKNKDLIENLKTSFNTTYKDINRFEEYVQLDSKKKILLIDNIHSTQLNERAVIDFLSSSSKIFSRIIVSIDTAHSMLPSINAEFRDFHFFSIKPFGFKKKDELVQKYLISTSPENSSNSIVLYEKSKELFD